jgi:peptidoglycan hydrolase-like protein with peptidoglycan-binding domain
MSCYLPSAARAGLSDIPPLEVGSRGGEVAIWQATVNDRLNSIAMGGAAKAGVFLHKNGPLIVDGVFGPLTKQATRLFQGELNLRMTGVVDLATWKATTVNYLTSPGGSYPEIGRGSWSAYVTWWQIGLDRWLARHEPGIPLLIPDGVFGSLTERATKVFQRSTGIGVDGIAGQVTWRRLRATGLLHMS